MTQMTPITATEIKRIVEEIKGKLKAWKIEPGYFTLHEGLSMLPIGTTATDMKSLETLTKINTLNDNKKAENGWESMAKFGGVMVAIIVVAYMALSAYKGG